MLFEKTEKLIKKLNVNDSASLPTSEDISLNKCSWKDDIEVEPWDEYEIMESYRGEYNENIKNNIFYSGCSFKVYEENYYPRFNKFLEDYPDAPEYRFVLEEISKVRPGFRFPFVDEKLKLNITFSFEKIEDFLMEKLSDFGYEIYELVKDDEFLTVADFCTHDFRQKKDFKTEYLAHPINLKIKDTEFMELFKALWENGNFRYKKQGDALIHFSKLFNININNSDTVLQNIRGRNNGSETLFLDKLKSKILSFVNKKTGFSSKN